MDIDYDDWKAKVLNEWLDVNDDPKIKATLLYKAMKWLWTQEKVIDVVLEHSKKDLKDVTESFWVKKGKHLISWFRNELNKSEFDAVLVKIYKIQPFGKKYVVSYLNNNSRSASNYKNITSLVSIDDEWMIKF